MELQTRSNPNQGKEVISKHNAEHYKWGKNCDGWHLVKSQNLSVIQERVPPGEEEVRHYHNLAEQFFFVLSGTATIEVAGVTSILASSDGIHVPAKTPHQVKNTSNSDLEIIVTSTPKSHGDRVEF